MKYLTVSFSYRSNEHVCQGLQNIFEYIDGVPPFLIFDNDTVAGASAARCMRPSCSNAPARITATS